MPKDDTSYQCGGTIIKEKYWWLSINYKSTTSYVQNFVPYKTYNAKVAQWNKYTILTKYCNLTNKLILIGLFLRQQHVFAVITTVMVMVRRQLYMPY